MHFKILIVVLYSLSVLLSALPATRNECENVFELLGSSTIKDLAKDKQPRVIKAVLCQIRKLQEKIDTLDRNTPTTIEGILSMRGDLDIMTTDEEGSGDISTQGEIIQDHRYDIKELLLIIACSIQHMEKKERLIAENLTSLKIP